MFQEVHGSLRIFPRNVPPGGLLGIEIINSGRLMPMPATVWGPFEECSQEVEGEGPALTDSGNAKASAKLQAPRIRKTWWPLLSNGSETGEGRREVNPQL